MRALIFAAGVGNRMRPLTATTPKPLLPVRGKPLIAYHLERIAATGIDEVVINTAHLAEQFPQILGDGSHWGLRIHYVCEGTVPLETGGGMLHALPWLGTEPFLAINGDIFTDFDPAALPRQPQTLAHLVLVDNPVHHPDGDFRLAPDGSVRPTGAADGSLLTFAGIGVYRPELLQQWQRAIGNTAGAAETPPRFKLAPVLTQAMTAGRVTGQHHAGTWSDVGTPERLRALDS